MTFLKKKSGYNQLSELDAIKVLEDFFIGENLLYAKSLLIKWQEFGVSTRGSLKLVFMEMI
jgi:hypothetical protein